jgi:AhpD family alkylhydroperoxidase
MMDRQEVLEDVRGTFGDVPEFIKELPDNVIGEIWGLIKKVQLSDGALPRKQKTLIGLAVAATRSCRYCVYFMTEAAKVSGATEAEIHEAILSGGMVNLMSTHLNGLQLDFEHFKKQTDGIMENLHKRVPAGVGH